MLGWTGAKAVDLLGGDECVCVFLVRFDVLGLEWGGGDIREASRMFACLAVGKSSEDKRRWQPLLEVEACCCLWLGHPHQLPVSKSEDQRKASRGTWLSPKDQAMVGNRRRGRVKSFEEVTKFGGKHPRGGLQSRESGLVDQFGKSRTAFVLDLLPMMARESATAPAVSASSRAGRSRPAASRLFAAHPSRRTRDSTQRSV